MSMFDGLFSAMHDKKIKNAVAELLRTDPAKLAEFEAAYAAYALSADAPETGNLFDTSGRQVRDAMGAARDPGPDLENIIARAVDELVADTRVIRVSEKNGVTENKFPALPDGTPRLTNDDLAPVPPQLRPQAAGSLMKVDIGGEQSFMALLWNYKRYLDARTPKERRDAYHMFRQGLDILDLDPVTYEMLGMNRNTMSYWLPPVAAAARKHGFFRIPETVIAKVPMPLLQLSRLDYELLSPATMRILDEWAYRVFGLDESREYFVKTGIFSSKFDFRNARVAGPKEVRELGEYLLFIHHQTVCMAGPLSQPSIYGAATTNEWCVRDYIPDSGNNPCIYKGMPLRTEYRVFVDFDAKEILGVAPYWDPNVMKSRFADQEDASSVHNRHDYVIYAMHEPVLMKRYEENKDKVAAEIAKLLPDTALAGQWSVDVMQDGGEFWLIDMATADTSALNDCVPKEKLRKSEENWIPALPFGQP